MLARCGSSGFGVEERSIKRVDAASSVLTALSQHLHFSVPVQALLTGKKQGMLKRRGPHCLPLRLPPLQQRSQHPGRPENCMRPRQQTSPMSRGFPEAQGLRHTNTLVQHVAWIGTFARRRVLFI